MCSATPLLLCWRACVVESLNMTKYIHAPDAYYILNGIPALTKEGRRIASSPPHLVFVSCGRAIQAAAHPHRRPWCARPGTMLRSANVRLGPLSTRRTSDCKALPQHKPYPLRRERDQGHGTLQCKPHRASHSGTNQS